MTSRVNQVKWVPGALVACLLVNLITAISPVESWATSGGLLELPISPTGTIVYSRQSELDLRIDTTWGGVHGYRPVTCSVSARTPVPADRQIMIRFLAGNWRNDQPAIVVEKEFELPAGTLSASVRLLVPQYVEWRSVGCETWVDGIRDEQLSVRQLPFANNQAGQNFTAMLYDDIDRISWRLFRNIRGGPAELFESPTGALLERWTEYSAIDVVVTSLADLKANAERDPDRLPELLKWIRAGGNLWISSPADRYEQIDDVEKILGFAEAAAEPDGEDICASLLRRGWRFPKVENQTSDAIDQYSQLYGHLEDEEKRDQEDHQVEDSRQWFAVRPLGMGTVTVFAGRISNLSQPRSQELSWAITQSLLADRLAWEIRHGNDPDNGNDNFNDFLIPDVGAAPVTAFQVLLSLFVLGIGPINYFLLKRHEKLPLLLITVPAAALVTTLLLLIYGFTSEGFGTLVRARSFTLLDQTADTAACWSRLSYFAGVAPSEGLTFPTDALVYPILPSLRLGDHREMRRYANQRRELDWNGVQRLTHGWLASRTPTQYLTIASRDTKQQVSFNQQENSLTATNELGVNVQTLIVEAEDGMFYLGEKLANGKSLTLSPIDQIRAVQTLRNLMSDNEPQFPAGTLESLSIGSGIDLLPLSRNLMETQLSALTSAASKGWGPRTYIAITDRGIDLALGLEEITENSSFHVIRGVW